MSKQSGRSTRLVDKYIQDLFTDGEVVITDHYDTKASHIFLLHRVLKRLESEHPHAFKLVEVKDLKIKLKVGNNFFHFSCLCQILFLYLP